jgi:hypothetical protein
VITPRGGKETHLVPLSIDSLVGRWSRHRRDIYQIELGENVSQTLPHSYPFLHLFRSSRALSGCCHSSFVPAQRISGASKAKRKTENGAAALDRELHQNESFSLTTDCLRVGSQWKLQVQCDRMFRHPVSVHFANMKSNLAFLVTLPHPPQRQLVLPFSMCSGVRPAAFKRILDRVGKGGPFVL